MGTQYEEVQDFETFVRIRLAILKKRPVDLAEQVGVGRSSVTQWVKEGNLPPDRIKDFAAFLETDPYEILSRLSRGARLRAVTQRLDGVMGLGPKEFREFLERLEGLIARQEKDRGRGR